MKKTILIIIFVVLIVSFSIGYLIFQRWNRPLGMALGLPTPTPAQLAHTLTSTTDEIEERTNTPQEEPEETEPPTAVFTGTEPQPQCGGPPLMYILGIGVDRESDDYLYGLADVIRVARVDFVTPKVTVLTIPRDLWVEFPDLVEKYADTVTHGKLNQAYLYGSPGMGYYAGSGEGPGLLAHSLAHNYGLYVDHYGAVNFRAFEKIIDALGGIDLYLDQDWDGTPVDENTEDMGYFEAGQHHMTGDEALRFARIRKRYSTMARNNNQTLVLCAVKDKLLSPSVVGSIPKLINSLIGEIQTDLTPAQLGQLACLLPRLSEENLQFISFPEEMMVPGREYDPVLGDTTFVWDIPEEDIRNFIRDFENDVIPLESDGGMSCP
jgi:polyisoprenyl-teichoic acid--peptidoglycan teichoic acid transferase